MPGRVPRRSRDAARALAVVAVLIIAGCGGDDEPSTQAESAATAATTTTAAPSNVAPDDPKQLIAVALLGALSSEDPAIACEESVTEAYLQNVYGDESGCAAAVTSGGRAGSIAREQLSIDGETATAVAVPSKGPNAGERLSVVLRREGNVWKVDSIESNTPVGP